MLAEQGQTGEAEPLLKRAIAIGEKRAGPNASLLSAALFDLAMLYAGQGRFEQSEALLRRSLEMRFQTSGPDHPLVELTFKALALVQSKAHQTTGQVRPSSALHADAAR
jgi:hypothetical protein